ncbi:MAG: Maf family protein, partial [Anaerorhabdus sp.]
NNNKMLGKPTSKENAREMISSISGKTHQVISGVAIINCNTNESYLFYQSTNVTVSPLTMDQIESYISSDEPYDKAGAYAIQGMFGKYIEVYDGDFNNVVGFPINQFKKVLKTKNWI